MSETSTFRPNWTSPPGETILDILNERQLSVGLFAKKLNQSPKYIDGLLQGYEIISTDVAEMLEATLGGSSDFWLAREFQ